MEYADLYYERNPEMRNIHRCEKVLRCIYKIRKKITGTILATAMIMTPNNIIADWQNQVQWSTPQNFPSCSAVRLNYSRLNSSGRIAPAVICNPVMNHGTVPQINRTQKEIEV